MPPIWVGFEVENSLKRGRFFSKLSLSMGGFSMNWRKIAKNGWFSAKIRNKSGHDKQISVIRREYLSESRVAAPHVCLTPAGVTDLWIDGPHLSTSQLPQLVSDRLQMLDQALEHLSQDIEFALSTFK